MDPYIECKHSAEYNQEKDEEAHTPIAAGSMNTVNSTTRTGDYEKRDTTIHEGDCGIMEHNTVAVK